MMCPGENLYDCDPWVEFYQPSYNKLLGPSFFRVENKTQLLMSQKSIFYENSPGTFLLVSL